MHAVLRLMSILGLAILALVIGAMRFDPILEPVQVSTPPAINTQVLGSLGWPGSLILAKADLSGPPFCHCQHWLQPHA